MDNLIEHFEESGQKYECISACKNKCLNYGQESCQCNPMIEIRHKLFAYESTGLTPEEITALIAERGKLSSELAYEKLANQTIPTMNSLVKRSADKIGKLQSERDTLKNALELACISFTKQLSQAYDVKPDFEAVNHNVNYFIKQAQEQEGKK